MFTFSASMYSHATNTSNAAIWETKTRTLITSGLHFWKTRVLQRPWIITPLWVAAHAPCMHLQCSVWLPFMPWYRSFIVTPQGDLSGLRWMLQMVFECVLNVNWVNGWGRYGGLRNYTQDLHTFNALLNSWNAYCMVENAYTQGFWCWC